MKKQAGETSSNIPAIEFKNLYLEDPIADKLWSHWFGETTFRDIRPHFVKMGEAAAEATPLSARADKQSPVLFTHDARGERIDRVVYHPDYHRMEELSYGKGIVGIKYDQTFLKKHREHRHLAGFGAGYYFAQTEVSLYCPICMTDGVGRVLERNSKSEIAKKTIEHLAATDRSQLWRGAMFLTEKQGGSDVGSNETIATQKGDRWFLRGDKWFCSNVDAEAILALARMPEGPAGTKGLGLFLVLRQVPEQNGSTIRIHRIKDKLGVRSMPTGEVTLEDTEAFLIGGIGEGFKQMAEMLNLSRLYNSVASMGGMRRGILEALAYGSERKAFGKALRDLPLWRAGMADLVAENLGMLLLVFETVRALDAADMGDEQARRLVRLTTPMAKALSGKLAMFVVSESIEAVGGNAYIEEHPLPRVLRDCQVLPIWEGTTNILCLDALRAVKKEKSHEPFFERLSKALETASKNPLVKPEWITEVTARMRKDQESLAALGSMASELQEQASRAWVESAGRTLSLALLLELASAPDLGEIACASYRRLEGRSFSTAPLASALTVERVQKLAGTEEVLLDAGYRK